MGNKRSINHRKGGVKRQRNRKDRHCIHRRRKKKEERVTRRERAKRHPRNE